jgi:hypothetical protein
MTSNEICERARIAYDLGIDPVDYAETELTTLIGAHLGLASICADLEISPPAGTLTTGAMSRRILGSLLDAGWTPPAVASEPEVTP